MTASEKAAVKSAQKASFGKVFAVQIAAYVVLVVLALIPGISYGNAEEPAIVSFTVVASVAMIALLAVFNPFRDGLDVRFSPLVWATKTRFGCRKAGLPVLAVC